MRRTLFDDEHQDFRASWRTFLEREVAPHYEWWERERLVPREVFAKAGEHGFLGMAVPEEHGGAGVEDFRFNVVLSEEAQRAGLGSVHLGMSVHSDICLPYFMRYATGEQRGRWLPGLVSGELIAAIAMTEPGTGSDLAGIATTAVRKNGEYVVNGAKTFITNGINADLVITAVRTDRGERHRGLSLLVVERDTPGFERGRNLEKIGTHAQDTAELFFDDARVPAENLLGNEGEGFAYLVSNLPQERLSIAVAGVAAAEAALRWTVGYVRDRKAFGAPIGSFQNTRFELAEMRTEVDVGQAYVDRCVEALNAGELTAEDAAGAKWWCTELQGRVVDRCLQLHGGYGYMLEYPIARAYADARVSRIYGGSNEIMKEIVGRAMKLE
ncbi:MAG: acyl-CoA dehydrogenase family protein [Solirubrobacterales bacterium]